jgi:hypothetical protein
MRFMSFGPDAGHLMEELLKAAGAGEASINTVELQPEADAAAMNILREAAEGGWVIEILDAGDEPDTGEGEQIMLRGVGQGEIHGETLNWENGTPDGGYLRLDLRKVEQVHIF